MNQQQEYETKSKCYNNETSNRFTKVKGKTKQTPNSPILSQRKKLPKDLNNINIRYYKK